MYVPPNGSVRNGSKLGVDFYLADDKLWERAEEDGIIDAEDDETNIVQVKSSKQLSSPNEKEGRKDRDVKAPKSDKSSPKYGNKGKTSQSKGTVKDRAQGNITFSVSHYLINSLATTFTSHPLILAFLRDRNYGDPFKITDGSIKEVPNHIQMCMYRPMARFAMDLS